MSDPRSKVPPVDVETYVPTAITVVRRSRGWPGLFLQERRGKSGSVHYPAGIRQHMLYLWLRPLSAELVAGGTRHVLQYAEGEARFTPAGLPVAFRWHGDVHVLMLGFERWYLERVSAELGCPVDLPTQVNTATLPASHPANLLVRQLAAELDTQPGSTLVADGLARAIAVLLLRHFQNLPPVKAEPAAPPAAVLRAVTFMRRHLADSLSLGQIAAASGLSPFHFSRQFKAATGHPPHEYLIRLRIDRAQELLRQHGRSWNMAAIAREVGFSDQSHLARHFKRVLGITPGEFIS